LEKKENHKIESKTETDLDVFSDSEIEVLNIAYTEYGNMNSFDLAELSHDFPEWKKHEEKLTNKLSTRELMDYDDFFKNPTEKNAFKNIFNESEETLKQAKDTFAENNKIASYWL
jgi:6-pyruvoyl-tetrahydropterin synthase